MHNDVQIWGHTRARSHQVFPCTYDQIWKLSAVPRLAILQIHIQYCHIYRRSAYSCTQTAQRQQYFHRRGEVNEPQPHKAAVTFTNPQPRTGIAASVEVAQALPHLHIPRSDAVEMMKDPIFSSPSNVSHHDCSLPFSSDAASAPCINVSIANKLNGGCTTGLKAPVTLLHIHFSISMVRHTAGAANGTAPRFARCKEGSKSEERMLEKKRCGL